MYAAITVLGHAGNRICFFDDNLACRSRVLFSGTGERRDSARFPRLCRRRYDRRLHWSLLIPAIEEAEAAGGVGWVPAAGGLILGVAFLLLLDNLLPHLHIDAPQPEGISSSLRRTTLLVFAVTLHNIPEGIAVGLSFARAAQHSSNSALYASAMALAIGIGIQNFPEGAAISLPLRQEGFSRRKSFLCGSLSGIVEPIFAIFVVLIAGGIEPLMPWLLSFAAGAMLYIVVEEFIPKVHLGEHSNIGTGFLIMTVLDVALG